MLNLLVRVFQDKITKTTPEEAVKVYKFVCPHLNCGHRFTTKRGLNIHASKCCWQNEFKVSRILDCKGPLTVRSYLIRWAGHEAQCDTWEPRSNIHPELIQDFEKENGLYDHG